VRAKVCKHCAAPILWWHTPSDDWRAVELAVVPWHPQVRGVVLEKATKTLADAATAWPEPEECLPLHRCPGYLQDAALGASDVDGAQGLWGAPLDVERWLLRASPPGIPVPLVDDRERWLA